jgi:hypothetical protein
MPLDGTPPLLTPSVALRNREFANANAGCG